MVLNEFVFEWVLYCASRVSCKKLYSQLLRAQGLTDKMGLIHLQFCKIDTFSVFVYFPVIGWLLNRSSTVPLL